MWTMSVLLCFSTKETVSEPYKVEPYTFHVCCLFFFWNAFSTLPSVAVQVSLFVSRLACLVEWSRKEFFFKPVQKHKASSFSKHSNKPHPYAHTHTHTVRVQRIHTHTHVHNVKCEWIQGLAVVVGAMVNLVVALMLWQYSHHFPVIICPFERVLALQCSGTPVQASSGSVGWLLCPPSGT